MILKIPKQKWEKKTFQTSENPNMEATRLNLNANWTQT